jgi:hypothetical protein
MIIYAFKNLNPAEAICITDERIATQGTMP